MLEILQKHKIKIFITLGIIGSIVLVNLLWDSTPDIHPLTQSWEKAVPHQEIPLGLASLSAEYCGICHQQHYEEWQWSTHAHAWTDLQFQAELKKESSPFMCINCHIPLQNQQEYIIEGLIDGDIYKPVKTENPHFDAQLQAEGITCASCHVRNNTIIGPTGIPQVPHQTVKDAEFLSENLCISCHNASAVITPTLACSFETGDEWKAGPYHPDTTCITCHMESVEREIAVGFGKKQSRYHYFPGSGIPKLASAKTRGLNGLAIYPAPFDSAYAKSDSIFYTVKVVNEFAGHKVPSGDPERFYHITFTLSDEEGRVLSTQTEKIGEEWQWYPTVKKLSDNNLEPNEARTFTFAYLPSQSGQLQLEVNITKHRLNQENAEYNKLTEEYPLFITVFEETYTIQVE